MKLSDRALLVQLNISQWGDTKEDKDLSRKLADDMGGKQGAYRARKSLLSDCDLLQQIKRKSNFIRHDLFYKNTLPWGMKGVRIVSNTGYLPLMTEFRKHRGEWEALVKRFIPEFEHHKAMAQRTLGAGYKESDYPRDIADRFSINIATDAVPTGDFRTEIASDELERIREEVAARAKQGAQVAMREAWDRLHTVANHMAEKLNDPSAIFRDTLVSNVEEVCRTLTALNITDDPNLEAMRSVVEQKLAGHHPDALRNDPDLRREIGRDAQAIVDAMGAFMGQAA